MKQQTFQQLKKFIAVALKRDGLFTITLLGKEYKVCYEASHYHAERDYAVIRTLAKGKQCILDVGANVGTSTLLLAEDNHANIYAFEASEFASNVILQNVTANGIEKRVTIINTLVADKTGIIIPFYWAFSSGGASIFKGRLGHNIAINKISMALDDYVSQNFLRPDLIKIDVEGAERMVLNGALSLLRESKPIVFLELHAMENIPLWQNAADIIDLIKGCDYKMVYLKTKETIVDVSVLKDRGRCHVLLIHRDHPQEEILNILNTEGL